jgi:hypothetical protein
MPEDLRPWRQAGRLYLWRYTGNVRNFPGWHTSADRAGTTSMLELVSALQASDGPVHRTLSLTPPTDAVLSVPNNPHGSWSPQRWRIAYEPSEDATSLWSFPPHDTLATLRIGREWLSRFGGGFGDIFGGEGDYSIGEHQGPDADSEDLWFWWHPRWR